MQIENVGSVTSIIVHGAAGPVGARICALASEDTSFALVGAIVRRGSARVGEPAASAHARVSGPKLGVFDETMRADVVLDFSSAQGAIAAIDAAAGAHAALLVGSTGLSETTLEALRKFSTSRAVLVAPNTSLGVAALADAVARVARLVGAAFEISIVEAHHTRKKDAPSGTALRLAHAARSAGATVRADQIVSLRGGDVFGEHTVRFAGPGEYIELSHRATSRDLFALGALRAAAWLRGRAPGWYTMEDVLGLTRS